MGAKNTKPVEVVVPTPAPPSGFNVFVTKDGKELHKVDGAVTIEDEIRRSYEAGKQEGLDTIHRSLDSVAAQVYDNVHEQLVGMQGQQLTKVAELATTIKSKLIAAPPTRKLCEEQQTMLLSCLQAKHKNLSACDDIIQSFEKCSFDVITE